MPTQAATAASRAAAVAHIRGAVGAAKVDTLQAALIVTKKR